MLFIKGEGKDLYIKSWCNTPEEGALAQAKNLAKFPFAVNHICLMPDTHQGYGMPIGGVMATDGVVVPNAVGVDIGCGMYAVRTNLIDITTERLKMILGGSKEYKGGIRAAIPVGFNKHHKKQDESLMPDASNLPTGSIALQEWSNALHSLGTLGGGNHFIEIQKGSDDHVWVMIHSGSRNLGKKVADHYNAKAVELNMRSGFRGVTAWDLAFLRLDEEIGQAYLSEMRFCVDFALANRALMMVNTIRAFANAFDADITISPRINIAHNYARIEHHFDKDVVVHRKGATSARLGELGIIPGSQGTPSYLVIGKGNRESFMSCSHGAGRKMGRKQATRELNLEDEIKRLDDQCILHSVRGAKSLDEAAGAYKDIDTVMSEQNDLVDTVIKLQPLAVVKG